MPLKMSETNHTKYLEGHEATGILLPWEWECKTVQQFGKVVLYFLTKLDKYLPHDSIISFQKFIWKKYEQIYRKKKTVLKCL